MKFLKLRTGKKEKPETVLVNASRIEWIHPLAEGGTCIHIGAIDIYAKECIEEIENMLGYEKNVAVFDTVEFNRRKKIKELRKKADELRDKYVKSGSKEDKEEYRETLEDLKAVLKGVNE